MDGFHRFQRAQFPLPQQLRPCRKAFEIFYADLGNQTDPGSQIYQIYQIYCRIFSWSHQRSLAGQQNFRLNSPGTVFQFVQTTYFPNALKLLLSIFFSFLLHKVQCYFSHTFACFLPYPYFINLKVDFLI